MTQEDKNKQVEGQVDNDQTQETQEQSQNAEPEIELSETDKLKAEVAELKDKYIRLYSEFDNFRRRTSKEKIDLMKNAGEDVLVALLPILDDFERAEKSMGGTSDIAALKEGVNLIYTKLFKLLELKGLKPMESNHQDFNSELHEAITQAPASSPDLKGKVIDTVEKGYTLNEKVIRFAKVVIGS